MKLRSQTKKRVRIWRGTRQPIRAFEGDPELLPTADVIAEALREAEAKAQGNPRGWDSVRDRRQPANPWSGKA